MKTVNFKSNQWLRENSRTLKQTRTGSARTHQYMLEICSRYVACMLMVLFMGVGNAWGTDTELFSTDFVNDWSNATLVTNGDITTSTPTYPAEMYFRASGSGKTVTISDNGVTQCGNLSVNNNIAGVKLSGINGSITITLAHTYSKKKPTYRYYFVDGATAFSSSVSGSYSTSTAPSSNGDPAVITINNIENSTGVFYFGAASSSYYSVASITITTPAAASCEDAPTVSSITKGATTATTQIVNCAGISSLGSEGCTISSYGFVYGTSANPTISDTKVQVGTTYTTTGTAFATTTLTGLTPSTTYYVRAYATNGAGTAYSSGDSFTTPASIGNVVYIAGSADASNDAIKALRDANYVVAVRTKAASPDYTGVDLVVLDESLSWADSDEGGSVIAADVPILNLKAFFYTLSNRWNWGTPVNPSPKSELATLSTEYSNVSSHPIFDGVTISEGAVDMIGTAKDGNNLQGVTTSTLVSGKEGYTLATSASGTTCIHELTPAQRGVTNSKYLLIALSNNVKDNYSADAKKMIVNAAAYLIDNSEQWEPAAPSCAATAEAGADKSTTVGEGVAMAATAATSGYTGAWSIKTGSPSTDAGQLGTTSSNTMTFTPASVGMYTLIWTVTDDSDGSCYATDEAAVTVSKADMPSTGLATGTATSITVSGATLPFTMTSTTGVGSLTIKVYDDNDDVVKTVTNITPATSGSQAVTGLSASTTYYYKITPIGDANHNDGDETSASSTFTTLEPACSAPTSPSISGTTSYTAGEDIELTASATGTDESTTYQWYKGDPADSGVSQGDASTDGATFTIDGCEVADAGTYYCVISNGAGCDVTTYQAITVAKASMPSTGLATGTATSITTSGATLPFKMTSTTGVGSLTIKVYDDNDDVVKTVTNITPATSGSQAVTGLSAGTTYYYTITPIGDANHNDGSETSASSTFTTETVAYSVTYAANGGSGDVPTDANTYSPNADVTVLGKNNLSKSGYAFCGWSYNGYVYVEGDKFEITEDATLTAVWNQNATTVTLTNFATSQTSAKNNIPDSNSKYFYGYKGSMIDANAVTLTTSNTNTKGQNDGVEIRVDNSATLRIYADNTTNATPATFSNVTCVAFDAKLYNSGSTSRTQPYTVKVGGTSVGTGSVVGLASDGYQAKTTGTFAARSGHVEIVLDNTGSSNTNLYIDNIAITYSASTYKKVSFNKGSGPSTVSGLPADRYVPSGSKISRPSTDPTATGYIFNGWVTESGGSTSFDFDNTTITTDKTIYAKWTAKTQPTQYTVSGDTYYCPGSTATITLSGSESGASYQLKKNGSAQGDPKAGTSSALSWTGMTAGTYTISAVENATYAARDMSGSVIVSAAATTAISTQPTTSVSAAASVNFTLGSDMVTAGHGLDYQWFSYTSSGGAGEAEVDGAESATYTTSKSAGTYYYKVKVSGDCGDPVYSDMITVTVKIAPNVYSLSGEPTALCGGTATLTLSGSDDGVTYKLYKGGVDLSDDKVGDGNEIEWTGIDAAGTYTVKTVETSTYAEAPMSGSVTISIMTPTSISTQPTTSVTAHDGVNFTLGSDLVGAGEGTLTYQWYSYTGSDGAGEATVGSATTTKTLTTSKSAGTYYYKVEVIGECGSVKSNMITVTVDNEHYLTYSANNGSGAPTGDYYAPGSITLNSTTIPTRSGYIFLGWNTKDDGTGDMYQPGASFTMPSTATTLYAAWASPCFQFKVGTAKAGSGWDVADNGSITTALWTGSPVLSGGTMTNTSGTSLAANNSYGIVMVKNSREITLTLTGGQFQAGTVIALEGTTNKNGTAYTYGFSVGGNAAGSPINESTNNYVAIKQRYVVTAGDGIEGTSSCTIEMNSSATGSQTYLSAIYIGGCMSCTTITPTLSYSATTLYAFGGTPSTATATLTGNTGGGAVSYSSSNPGVVSVNASTGAIEAVGAGTATITALVAAVGDYCGGSATCTITVPALITQTINVATSSTGVAWGTPPDMTFTPSDKGMTQESVIANGTGDAAFTFDASATSNSNRNGRYMTAQFTGSATTKGKYLTMSFSNDDYNVRLNEVVVPFQPITNDGTAQVEIYEDGELQMTSTEVSDITKGQITDVHFSFASVKTLKAGATVEVRIYFYGQTTGFRLASPILVNGGVVTSAYTPAAEGVGVSNLWSDPANWDWGVAPTINNDVVINREFYVDVKNATAKSVTLTGDAQLIINAGMALTVAGNVTKDGSQTAVGDVVLRSTQALGTGALIMNPATVTIAPKATVEQATKTGKIGSDWINQHVGTPFSDGNSYNNWYGSYVYYYDAAGGSWVNVKRNTSDASLVPFRGYNVLRSDATTFWMQGTVNQPITDDVELSAVKNGGETTTENMFANSWLAPIDITAFADEDFVNIDKVIYIFNAGTPAQYADLIAAGTTSVDGGTAAAQWMALPIDAVKDDPSSFSYTVIPSMQGFKVLANAADAKLKLNYDKLVYQPALDLLDAGEDLPIKPNLAPEMRHSTDDKPEVLALNVRGESGYGDRVLLFVREDFTNGYDDGWEGSKMTGMSIAPQMYAVSEAGNMSIDAVPEAEGTVIGFRAGQDNNYTFTFRYEGNDVLYLNDMLTETSTRIHEGFSYDFTTADGDIETRFVISHTPFVKTTPTGMDNVQGDEGQSVRKLFYQGVMYIIRGGKIYNASGERVK